MLLFSSKSLSISVKSVSEYYVCFQNALYSLSVQFQSAFCLISFLFAFAKGVIFRSNNTELKKTLATHESELFIQVSHLLFTHGQ